MFKHEDSQSFVFGKKCLHQLCQCKHTESLDHENENREDMILELRRNFVNLSEVEQNESKELFCDLYCKASYGYHVCQNDDFNGLNRCDVQNIKDVYIMGTEFPCEKCDERFHDLDRLMKHFEIKHTTERLITCKLNNCNFSGESIEMVRMHIGVNHNE